MSVQIIPEDKTDEGSGFEANKAVKRITESDTEHDWIQQLDWIQGNSFITGLRSGIDVTSTRNIKLLMLHHPDLKNCFAYDIFADQMTIIKCPPWEKLDDFQVRKVKPHDNYKLRDWFAALPVTGNKRFNLSKEQAADALREASYTNEINPPRDYFNSIRWDKTKRLDKWLSYYLGAEQSDYTMLVGRKWLVAAVARVFVPGTKFESMLVLEGSQGIGKSRALRTLATINGISYFTDSSLNFNSDKPDSYQKLQGRLIIEMSELASWQRAKQEDIKMFISQQEDLYRPPYDTELIERPRMFVLAGTTNQIQGWLSDETGNRRYWPVRCNSVDIEALKKDTEQLWAEAVHLYKLGEQVWLDDEECKLAEAQQQDRVAVTVIGDDIERAIQKIKEDAYRPLTLKGIFTTSEVMTVMNIPIYQKTDKQAAIINRYLRQAGYKELRRYIGDKRIAAWGLE